MYKETPSPGVFGGAEAPPKTPGEGRANHKKIDNLRSYAKVKLLIECYGRFSETESDPLFK